VVVNDGSLQFDYELAELPLGRFTFRRWRWALWHGPVLRASGWRTSPDRAERALRTAAAYWAHEAAGLHALRADRSEAYGVFGSVVHVECGNVACVLLPRAADVRELEATA
jgi:hypothetical protein